MSIIVQSSSITFEPGSYRVIVDQISFVDNPFQPSKQQLEVVLRLAEDDSQTIRFYTAPILHPKGKLLPFCQALLKRVLTDTELKNGFDVEDLLGKDLIIDVVNALSKEGAGYAKVVNFSPSNPVSETDLTTK